MKYTKWNYSETLYVSGNYGYSASIHTGEKSTIDTDICEVWGKDKEEINKRLKLISKAPEMYEALKGVFRLRNLIEYDPLTTKAEHQDEAMAIHNCLKEIQSILKEIES